MRPSHTATLGLAALGDADLAELVAAQLGVPEAVVLSSVVEAHPYDRPAITTAGRHVVTGTARTPDGETRAFRFFVKVIQAYHRSPLRFAVPEPLRAAAAAVVPWRTEADLYRSDLRDRLPAGLTAPRAFAVRELEADSAALWLEQVPLRPATWGPATYRRAAYLLGRFAASRAIAPLVTAVHGARTPRVYADGRLAGVVRPAFDGPDLWAHPLVRESFDHDLRRRLDAAFEALPDLLAELDDTPVAAAHGDACPANLLLAADRPELVLVDFGFCGRAPLGTDLARLVTSEIQTGHRGVADLLGLDDACLDSYAAGLSAEGGRVRTARLRRSHAILMTVFTALSAVPVEHLGADPTAELRRETHARAAVARFVLDRLATARDR
ncbi:phosphotransferase [Pseudonocardia xishanensis]|uniref:Aminoglycoside phosphotransferase domain-containing protein n=1 Tax=Pseudonocardia xishanensis TaxID=630995 RepID=A0ABP8RTF6_9PSEU